MNELVKSQRKAIQYYIDKRDNEVSWFEKIRQSITIWEMQSELKEMMKPKALKL